MRPILNSDLIDGSVQVKKNNNLLLGQTNNGEKKKFQIYVRQ